MVRKLYLVDDKIVTDKELGSLYSITEDKFLYMVQNESDTSDSRVCFSTLEDAISHVEGLPSGLCYFVYKEKVLADYDYQVYGDDDLPGDVVGFLNYDSTVYVCDKTDSPDQGAV